MPESASLAKSSCSTSEFFMCWTFAAPSLKAYGAPPGSSKTNLLAEIPFCSK